MQENSPLPVLSIKPLIRDLAVVFEKTEEVQKMSQSPITEIY